MNGDRGLDPGALLRTGAEQLSRGDLVAARRTLEKALRLRPNSPDVLQLLGMVLSDQGEHEIALRQLKRAVAFDTVRASTRFNLAKALHAAGRLDAALESFRIAKS